MGDVVSLTEWLETRDRQNLEAYLAGSPPSSPRSLLESVLETAFEGTGAKCVVFGDNGPPGNRPTDYFGLCPMCHNTDGYLHVGPDQWFICNEHQVTWRAGSNMFSGWRQQTVAEHRHNARVIERYRVVKPFYWPESGEAQP